MIVLFIITVITAVYLTYRLVIVTKKLDNCKDRSLEQEDIHFSEILKLKEEISKKESLIKSVQATNKRLLREIEDFKLREGSAKEEVVKPKRKYTKKKK